ncbi:MAG: hemolysin III family protein [Planctomycetales bacterium]|nr:hemolysin III family protein [Planctomycetales bacterium]
MDWSSLCLAQFADPFSSLSHLIGAGMFTAFTPSLLSRARGDSGRLWSVGMFCVATVALLGISGFYHSLDRSGSGRWVFARIDHAAIFIFIACTFTPVHVILFRGVERWGVLAFVWTFGIVALALKIAFFSQLPKPVGLALYLAMGWIGLLTGVLLWRRHGYHFVQPMLWGGIAYSTGALLDAFHWPIVQAGAIEGHEVFHVAVLLGLALHWSFVYAIADGRLSPPR